MFDAIVKRTAGREARNDYHETLVTSRRVNWRIDDLIGGDKRLDFSRPFMPESLARVEGLDFLNEKEKLILNQIRGYGYLCTFGLAEEFILPFVLDHVRPSLDLDDYRVRAFLQFTSEEAKHIQLFKRFAEEFRKGFAAECKVIGPASEVAKAVLAHEPLAVALAILHIEWMTQRHFIDSVRDDQQLDPQFKSLLKHHWLEEAQHAKLDTMMVESLAEGLSDDKLRSAVDGYLDIGGFLDTGGRQQTLFDLESLEAATGRTLNEKERETFIEQQHQANRWTYIGTGITHPRFLDTLKQIAPNEVDRVVEVGPTFC
jgi:hypothetical protein